MHCLGYCNMKLVIHLNSSWVLYLIHIFPEIRHIPTPLGNIEKSKVNPEQIEAHMITVRSKRRELLHKFISVCYSAKVEVDTILLESDQIAKAILELIPVLQIPGSRSQMLGKTIRENQLSSIKFLKQIW